MKVEVKTEKERLVERLDEKWSAEFERMKTDCLKDLHDWHFYRLAVYYEILEWVREAWDTLSIEELRWLVDYTKLDQVFEWYCDREDSMWQAFGDVVYDNYQYDKDWGERHE